MHLGAELALLEQAGVGVVHVDVMDGCFCPAMTVGPAYVKGLRTPLLKDVHLMIHEPLDKLAGYVAAGADIITVQVEAACISTGCCSGWAPWNSGRTRSGHRAGAGSQSGHAAGVAGAALAGRGGDDRPSGGRSGVERADVRRATLSRVARVKEMIAAAGKDILVCVDGGDHPRQHRRGGGRRRGPDRHRQRRLRRQGRRGQRRVHAFAVGRPRLDALVGRARATTGERKVASCARGGRTRRPPGS